MKPSGWKVVVLCKIQVHHGSSATTVHKCCDNGGAVRTWVSEVYFDFQGCCPCTVTILRSSFGWGTESESLFVEDGGTWDLGGEATSFTPHLQENLPSQPSMLPTLSLSCPPYPGAQPPGPQAH